MDHGLRDLINEADSLGNTPLHVLIARYALEERKLAHSNSKSYGYHDDHQVWPCYKQMSNSSNINASMIYVYVFIYVYICYLNFISCYIQPWNKWDMLHIVRYLLQNGARPAINHGKNSALACVLRQVRYNRRIVNIEAELYN